MKFRTKRRMVGLARKARQIRGKVRRWLLDKFKLDFIRRRLAARAGTCLQCGKCCRLVYRCPFLEISGGSQICSIYEFRPAQCRHFPIDRRDLKELGHICGYSFKERNDEP